VYSVTVYEGSTQIEDFYFEDMACPNIEDFINLPILHPKCKFKVINREFCFFWSEEKLLLTKEIKLFVVKVDSI
jgi:hypothetical protein